MRSRGVRSAALAGMFALLFWTAAGWAQEKLDLRLRFSKGDVHAMTIGLEQTIDQTVQGAPQRTTQSTRLGYTLKVEDVDGQGAARISIRYDTAAYHVKTPAGEVDYDSTQAGAGAPPAMAAGLAAVVGQGYSFTVTPEGKVTQVTGLEKMLNAVMSRLNVEGPARLAAEKVLRQQLAEPNVRSNLQGMFAPFPDHPVAVGESWSRTAQISLGFPLETQTTYTLKARDKGIAIVDVAGHSSTAPDAALDLGQTKMSYDLKGDIHGQLQIQESTGWTWLSDSTQTLKGSATLRSPNVEPQTVPVSVESRMKSGQK